MPNAVALLLAGSVLLNVLLALWLIDVRAERRGLGAVLQKLLDGFPKEVVREVLRDVPAVHLPEEPSRHEPERPAAMSPKGSMPLPRLDGYEDPQDRQDVMDAYLESLKFDDMVARRGSQR